MNRNLFRNVANTLMASALVRFSALGKREEVELMGNSDKAPSMPKSIVRIETNFLDDLRLMNFDKRLRIKKLKQGEKSMKNKKKRKE